MTPRIREAIDRHGLHRSVRMLGKVAEEMLGRLYRGADLFVMPNIPSRATSEGFGVVMLEAGMCGDAGAGRGPGGDQRRGAARARTAIWCPARTRTRSWSGSMRYRGNRELVAEASRRAARTRRAHFCVARHRGPYVRLLQQQLGTDTTTTGTVPAELARAAG